MPSRSRLVYSSALVITVVTGLASRRYPGIIAQYFGKYPGDALWAAMMFFGWGLILSRVGTLKVALLAATTCLVIEALKLYQAPWLVSVRHGGLGHLIFGSVFSYENLIAYSVGILAALGLDVLLSRSRPIP